MIIARKKNSRQSRKNNCKRTRKSIQRKSIQRKSIQQKSINKCKNKKNLSGGATSSNGGIVISINYPNIGLKGNIENGSDLTAFYKAGELINAPLVNLGRTIDNQKYLVIMYDPDAPNGEGHPDNHNYVHWIFIQNGSNGSNTGISGRKTILEYQQPNPPIGTHRYIFNIYNANGIVDSDIKSLINSGRNTYNDEIMKKIPKIEHNPMMFNVSAI
jgi:phosphatidylethanolamine-binding protein (PEBP) family uncharacterized protein